MTNELFEPYKIGNLELRNRFVRSATWDATADPSGAVTETSVDLYRALGQGGIGLIISGYAFVSEISGFMQLISKPLIANKQKNLIFITSLLEHM